MVLRLLTLTLVGLWLARSIKTGVVPCASVAAAPAILAYLALAALSVFFSPYTNQSLQWLIVLLGYGLLLFVLVSSIERWDHVRKLVFVLIAMGAGEAVWAMGQWGSGRLIRPSGTFFNPNFLAGYLAAVWVVGLALVCYRWKRDRRRDGASRVRAIVLAGAVGGLAVLLATIVLTGSRGGMLATLVGTALVVGLRFGRQGLGLLLVLLLVGMAIANPVRERVISQHLGNPVGYARLQIWEASLRAMADHPLGAGLGLYQYVYPRYASPVSGEITRYGKAAQTAHNEYLQMGVELGLAGLLIFLWGVGLVMREVRGVLKERLTRWQRGIMVGAGAAVGTILAQAAVDANLHEPAIAFLLALCVGIILAGRRLARRADMPVRPVPAGYRWVWAGAGILLIVLAAFHVVRLGVAWMAFESGSRAAANQDVRTAIPAYVRAIELDPGKALYHSSLAAVYFRIYERTKEDAVIQAAVTELRTAMTLNPLDGRLPGLLGFTLTSLARPVAGSETSRSHGPREALLREAEAAYEQAARLNPFSPFYYFEAGRVARELGQPERAETWVRRSVELEPNFLPGREWLAGFYLDAERRDDAAREYQEIRERQQRYAGWVKDPVEAEFLNVDAAALGKRLAGGPRS